MLMAVTRLALDHVFICVEDPRAAEEALVDFGMSFGVHAIHAGQGTANACAFFDNAYLELLWRHDDEALQSEPVRPVALWERVRWRQTGASPFGVALRTDEEDVPIQTWRYDAPFLPSGSSIPIVTPRNAAHEPLIFVIPAGLPIRLRSPEPHRNKHRHLTRVALSGPRVSPLPAEVKRVCDPGSLDVRRADEHHVELEWNGGQDGGVHNFRPTLPLTLHW